MEFEIDLFDMAAAFAAESQLVVDLSGLSRCQSGSARAVDGAARFGLCLRSGFLHADLEHVVGVGNAMEQRVRIFIVIVVVVIFFGIDVVFAGLGFAREWDPLVCV